VNARDFDQRIDAVLRAEFAPPPARELLLLLPEHVRARDRGARGVAWIGAIAAAAALVVGIATWREKGTHTGASRTLAETMRDAAVAARAAPFTPRLPTPECRWLGSKLELPLAACTTWSAGPGATPPEVLGEFAVEGSPFDACVVVRVSSELLLVWTSAAAGDPRPRELGATRGAGIGRYEFDGRVLYVDGPSEIVGALMRELGATPTPLAR